MSIFFGTGRPDPLFSGPPTFVPPLRGSGFFLGCVPPGFRFAPSGAIFALRLRRFFLRRFRYFSVWKVTKVFSAALCLVSPIREEECC